MATLTSEFQYLGRSSALSSMDGTLKYYVLLYAKTKADINTGIHTVTIREVLASTNSGATFYQWYTSFSGKINNATAFSGKNKPWSAWELSPFTVGGVTYKEGTVIAEGSVNVDCSNGLTKDIPLSCTWTFTSENGTSFTPVPNSSRTASATVTLPAILRYAELITAPNFTDGDNPTITYSNPAGTAVDSLEVGIYDDTGYTAYVPYRSVSKTGTSYTFNLTDAERETLLSAVTYGDSVSVKFYIKTTINGTTHIAEPITRTFSISGANPVVTGSVQCDDDTYALTGNRNTLIKYFSNATATMTATPQKGATIAEDYYIIRNGDNDGYGSSCTFEKVENPVFTFSAEDDRGNVGTDTKTATMIEYIKLTCTIGNNRPDAVGNMTVTCAGDYFNASFGWQSNTLTVQYRYKATGGAFSEDDWEDMTFTTNGNRYYAYADFVITDFDQDLSYSFETRAIDKLMKVPSTESSVKSIPVFHWGENDFVFEVPVTFNGGSSMSVDDLTITGDLRLKNSGNFGNTIYFGDSNYVTIGEPYDERLVIKGTVVDLQGTIKHNGVELPSLQYGYWTPQLSHDPIYSAESLISSYIKQDGWYLKMGQNVTVGFFVKASCYSGNESENIYIKGLPFKPMVSAAGGGMCSGAYVSANCNFQCFVAETNGAISTRVQACNNTSNTNLSTSASGCCYRSGGGEITLSGTITYKANA